MKNEINENWLRISVCGILLPSSNTTTFQQYMSIKVNECEKDDSHKTEEQIIVKYMNSSLE